MCPSRWNSLDVRVWQQNYVLVDYSLLPTFLPFLLCKCIGKCCACPFALYITSNVSTPISTTPTTSDAWESLTKSISYSCLPKRQCCLCLSGSACSRPTTPTTWPGTGVSKFGDCVNALSIATFPTSVLLWFCRTELACLAISRLL